MHFPLGQPWLCANQGKERNLQGWSQKGSGCVMSFKHWDSSFVNKSFLLCIRERFRAIFVRHKSAFISFFVGAPFKQTSGRRINGTRSKNCTTAPE